MNKFLQTLKELLNKNKVKKAREKEAQMTEDEATADDEVSSEDKKKMDTKTPEGSKVMLEGDHGQIYGVSRPVVFGIGITLFVVLASAFIFASSGSQKTPEKHKLLSEQDLVKADRRPSNELSDDYGELHRANERMRSAQAPQPQTQQRQSVKPVEAPQLVTTPAQPPQRVATPTSPALPSVPAFDSAAREAENKLKVSRESAIAFFGGNTRGGSDGEGSGEAPPGRSGVHSASYTPYNMRTLVAGTTIPVMLLTGINSEAPGEIVAQIMADVFDAGGLQILIPAGSRILGKLGNVSAATGRIAVTFSSIVTPDGSSWDIGDAALIAMDGSGYSGVKGKVHRHVASNFLGDIYNSGLTALSSVAFDRVTIDSSALSSLTARQKPTTTVDPGYQFKVFAAKNIDF